MKCVVCGKEIKESMYQGDILCSHDCFTKNYWNNKLTKKAILINGECYHLGKGNKTTTYYILMNNGKKIKTNALYQIGTVPKELYSGDNAKFITEKEYNL